MRVRVLRVRSVPAGVVTIEDVYDSDEIVEIVFRFNRRDIRRHCARKFAGMLTVQAKAWAERAMVPNVEWHPVEVRVERDENLPYGVEVFISDDPGQAIYLFAPKAITEAGARAFLRLMQGRAQTWSRVGTSAGA